MEDKKLSELQSTAKEWVHATGKAFHQIDKELWLKGRIAVWFGIAIVWLLGVLVAHTSDRYEQSFDRDGRGSMMQDRRGFENMDDDMFNQIRNSIDRDFDRMWWKRQGLQWCSQQATIQIDPQNPGVQVIASHANCPFATQEVAGQNQQSDSIFDRMENRMKQMFGSDNKGQKVTTGLIVPTDDHAQTSVIVVTGAITQ